MNTNEIIDSLINSVPINTLPTTSVNNNNNRKRHHSESTQSLASQAIQTTDDGTLLTMERRMDNKLEISSPQEYFSSMLKSRGYPGTTFCSLKCGYHNSPTVSC